MGQGSSTASSQPFPRTALHCLRVQEGSPAYEAGIEPFFDYLVGFELIRESDGERVFEEPVGLGLDLARLARVLAEYEGREIALKVYSAKEQRSRYVTITPSRTWRDLDGPSTSATKPGNSLLGISMKVCDPALALGQVWHVLEVLEDSPAESAGLVPYGDYIVGWNGGPLRAEKDFYDLVETSVDKPVRLYVYSSDFDNLREIVLVPNHQWGGEGLLGCGIGYGLLHRIPPSIPPITTAAPQVASKPPISSRPSSVEFLHTNMATGSFGRTERAGEEWEDSYMVSAGSR